MKKRLDHKCETLLTTLRENEETDIPGSEREQNAELSVEDEEYYFECIKGEESNEHRGFGDICELC